MLTQDALRLRPAGSTDRSRALVRLPAVVPPNLGGMYRPAEVRVTFEPGFRPGLRVLKLD